MIGKAASFTAVLVAALLPGLAVAQQTAGPSAVYKSLDCPPPMLGTTWAVLQRDGAGRPVEPYLSSLGQGESGTGVVTSPPFVIAGDRITFTVRGHDGPGGGRGENYVALVDARKGSVLMKTAAPGDDALKERSWDVSKLKGVEVRIKIRDGNSGGAFAWLGVERIDAGPAMKVDFRHGLPNNWDRPERTGGSRYELLSGGIPFRRNVQTFTLMPKTGAVDIPCGFAAKRLFFLGCTVAGGKTLATYGAIEIHYRTGSPDRFPLLCGFTLDGNHKLLSPSKAICLHPSSDPFQHYLAIAPREEVIERIRLVAMPERGPLPRITAITCETAAENDRLTPLPAGVSSAEETAWIASHTVSAGRPKLGSIIEAIRKAHKLPPSGKAP